MNKENIFTLLDKIIADINKYKVEPLLSNEIESRLQRKSESLNSDADFLKEFTDLISYSQNARSDSVQYVWEKTNAFHQAFCNFDVNAIADLNANEVEQEHWQNIKVIRFKKKISSIIECAKTMQVIADKHGSFLNFFQQADIPVHINNTDDLDKFWRGFDYLMLEFKKVKMPFMGNVTTLLHLLLNMGYYCVKPDLVLLKFANEINITDKKEFVRLLQEYCLSRQMKPSVLDLYLLIYGGQLGARRFVKLGYYQNEDGLIKLARKGKNNIKE